MNKGFEYVTILEKNQVTLNKRPTSLVKNLSN